MHVIIKNIISGEARVNLAIIVAIIYETWPRAKIIPVGPIMIIVVHCPQIESKE